MSSPVLDVVIPVHNEQHTVRACVTRLLEHLQHTFPYPFRITIADNASTDATWEEACALTAEHSSVAAVRLSQKGRGRALKQVWLASDAPILAYMDVDLSTDLDAFWPLVAPLMSGHSDLAIGSRLHRGSRVVRGPKRELVSRCYNLLLRGVLGAGFSDAQCGFKAIRADVAAEVLPLVEDPSWFFDTELLVVAERCGLRIHEVPVDWYDDPDSRVDVVSTALDDLRGVCRLRRSLGSGTLPVAAIAERMGRGRVGAGLTDAGAAVRGRRGAEHRRAPRSLRDPAVAGRVGAVGQPAGAPAGHRGQHRHEPALDLRRPRPQSRRAAARTGSCDPRGHPADDLRCAGDAAPVGGRRADLGRDDGGRARDRVFDAGAVRGDAALDLPATARLTAG